VQITLLKDARPLKDRARVHFHCYTAETVAEVVLLSSVSPVSSVVPAEAQIKSKPQGTQGTQLKPGQTAWAQLRFAEPLLLLPGDRFILRQFSPVVTIGGGVVVDNAPQHRYLQKDARDFYRGMLGQFAEGSPSEQLVMRVARRKIHGLPVSEAIAETGWMMRRLEDVLAPLLVTPQQSDSAGVTPETLRIVRFNDVLITTAAFVAAQQISIQVVTAFHQANPLVAGISKEELREKLDLSPEVFNGVLDALVRERKLEIAGEQVRLAGRGVVMKDEEAESKRQIEQAFAAAGLKVPALKEVLAGLKVDRTRAQKIVTLLLRDRVLVKVAEDLVFHRDALDNLRKQILEYKKTSPKLDVGKFKDLTGVSRKYAIPLLEYLDRERVTRRVGDERVIL
jgi:selenocysteine-specific elongation factor